jgi:hypothetical protein
VFDVNWHEIAFDAPRFERENPGCVVQAVCGLFILFNESFHGCPLVERRAAATALPVLSTGFLLIPPAVGRNRFPVEEGVHICGKPAGQEIFQQ